MRHQENNHNRTIYFLKGVGFVRKNVWFRMTESLELDTEAIPGEPLIELFGNKRVLIENHGGILAYCSDSIHVKVKNGQICICGYALTVALMSKERLIISGRIDSVQILGRK